MEVGLMRFGRIICLLAAVAAAGMISGFPRAALAQEKADKVKAVFLFKFFDYVTWPDGQVPGISGDGMLCTHGSHALGDMLGYIAKRESKEFRFRVQHVGKINQDGACHVLYVAGTHDKPPALPSGKGVLTVGETEGFLQAGGVIRIKEDDGKVRLVIDLKNAEKNGLKISSRLLDIAEVRK